MKLNFISILEAQIHGTSSVIVGIGVGVGVSSSEPHPTALMIRMSATASGCLPLLCLYMPPHAVPVKQAADPSPRSPSTGKVMVGADL